MCFRWNRRCFLMVWGGGSSGVVESSRSSSSAQSCRVGLLFAKTLSCQFEVCLGGVTLEATMEGKRVNQRMAYLALARAAAMLSAVKVCDASRGFLDCLIPGLW